MSSRFWYWILIVFIVCASGPTLGEARGSVSAGHAPLSGISRFSFGDNGVWSAPAYDDSSWGLSGSGGASPGAKLAARGIGWHRIHFSLPLSSADWTDPAILLGRISGAEEVFLNGTRIGGEGEIGDGFVGASKVVRLYRIPRGLLNLREDNLLALRIMSMHPDREDFHGRILVGDYSTLLVEKIRSEFHQTAIEMVILSIFLLNFLVLVLNIVSHTLPRRMGLFGLFIFLSLVVYTMDSLLFYGTGWKTPFVQKAFFAMIALLPATVLLLYHEKVTFPTKATAVGTVLLSLGILFCLNRQSYSLLPYAWCLGVAGIGVWTLKVSWQNFANQIPDAGIILVGTLCLFSAGVFSAIEAINPLHPFGYYKEFLWVLGGPVFIYLWIYSLIRLFARFRKNQMELSKRILLTQERERERLSRELHDGIGQSLLAVKLSLDMIEINGDGRATVKCADVSAIKRELVKIIDEVRDVAAALRPSVFDRLNLSETIRDDVKRLERTSGIRITIDTSDVGELSTQAKHNAYRIYQESMTNILKHASATSVKINLAVQGNLLALEITDDGKGFDAAQIDREGSGLGLAIMRERAALLGGTLVIRTAPGSGTSILAEVPLP